jgi:hypothetical protein
MRYFNTADYRNTGSTVSKLLYVNSGEAYFVFRYNEIDLRLECYPATGFNAAVAWNLQPGLIKSDDLSYLDYSYIPLLNPFFTARSQTVHFIADTSSFSLVFFGVLEDFREAPYFISGGTINKFTSFTGGQYIYSTFSYQSNYYVRYEGLWYGQTIIKSMDHVQGYIDMLPLSSPYFNKLSGDLFLEGMVVGINTDINVDDSNKTPIGVLPNMYKHPAVTPTQPYTFFVNSNNYLSFRYKPIGTNAFNKVIAFRIT